MSFRLRNRLGSKLEGQDSCGGVGSIRVCTIFLHIPFTGKGKYRSTFSPVSKHAFLKDIREYVTRKIFFATFCM